MYAQIAVGNGQSGTATMYVIDVGSGVATPLYSSSTAEGKPWGMAADNVNSVLCWNSGTTLYSATFADLLGRAATE